MHDPYIYIYIDLLEYTRIKYVYYNVNFVICYGTWSKASQLMRDLNTRKIVYSN